MTTRRDRAAKALDDNLDLLIGAAGISGSAVAIIALFGFWWALLAISLALIALALVVT